MVISTDLYCNVFHCKVEVECAPSEEPRPTKGYMTLVREK
jgi:hypothetical protein